MKALILLLICGVVLIDCELIQKINHLLNQQNNTQQMKTANNSIQIPNQHHYLSSRVHQDNQNNFQTHLKTQSHDGVSGLFGFITQAVDAGLKIYDRWKQAKNEERKQKEQRQKQAKYEEQLIIQSLKDLPNPNMALATLLERGDCPYGQSFHPKSKKCVKCSTPNEFPLQNSLTGQVFCSFISPFVHISVALGVDQDHCILPNIYNGEQKACYTCPTNFVFDEDANSKGLFCWCDSPYIFKQVKGVKSCEAPQKPKQAMKNIATNSNNKNGSVSNCPENYIQKVDNMTKKSVCLCLSPDTQILQANGNKKCLKHICPRGGLYDTTLRQCGAQNREK